MRSRQNHDKQAASSSLPPSLQRTTDAPPAHIPSTIPSSGLDASFARTPALSLQRAPAPGAPTSHFGGQTDLSLAAPSARPTLAPTIQRAVDDPDGAIRKKFIDAAKKGGLRAFDVNNAKHVLTNILADNDTEPDAWDEWVSYWEKHGPALCHKSAEVIAQKMNEAKGKREKIDQEIGELVFEEDVGEKKDKGKEIVSDDEEQIDWDKETFGPSDLDYEKQLETHYPLIQDISERVLWEMYEEEGFLQWEEPEEKEITGEEGKQEKEEKKEPTEESGRYGCTDMGQKTLNKAIVKSQKGEGMDVTRLEQSFIFNHFKSPKSGSIKTRSNPEREHLTVNYQENRNLKSQGVPGVGTYDEHLERVNNKAQEGGLGLKDLFQDMEESHDERVKKMKRRVSLKLPTLKETRLKDISETLVKEEDKTEALNGMEQDRSYRDCLATSTAYEGIGSLWTPTMGLKNLNPMFHVGATTAAIKEQEGEELGSKDRSDRDKTLSVSKQVLKVLIDKTMDEKFKPNFQRRTGLFRRSKVLKKFLKDPKNKDAEEEMANEVRRIYGGKRKRTNSNPGALPDDPKKKKENEEDF